MKTFVSFCFLFSIYLANGQEIVDKETFKKCRKEFSKKICLSDEDGDGVLFYLDRCAKESGAVENNGCKWPDSDGDDVLDKDDACPSVAGPPENNGCPWPDTDGDGILDKDDACPIVPGAPELNGCPYGRNGRICPESYEQTKERYLKNKLALDNTDFSELFVLLFDNEYFKEDYFKGSKNILLYLKPIEDGPECGNDAYYDCPRYEKNIAEDVFVKLWSKENYKVFQKLSQEKNIIPFSKKEIWYQFEENYNYLGLNSIKPVFTGIFIDNKNKQHTFKYTSNRKPITQFKHNSRTSKSTFQYVSIRVLPIEYKNLENAYIIDFIITNDFKYTNKQLIYQFEEKRWKFIEEFKLQIKN